MSPTLRSLAKLDFYYLTTTCRKSGKSRTIEIWFAAGDSQGTIYLLSSGRDRSD